MTEVYLSLGGNIGDSEAILTQAIIQIKALSEVAHVEVSRYYVTEPWEMCSPQRDFLNAACRLYTTLSAPALCRALQTIEVALGKTPKSKNRERILDIDILFFGQERYCTSELEIPHPRWRKRQFVVEPLLDLVTHLTVPLIPEGTENVDLRQLLQTLKTK